MDYNPSTGNTCNHITEPTNPSGLVVCLFPPLFLLSLPSAVTIPPHRAVASLLHQISMRHLCIFPRRPLLPLFFAHRVTLSSLTSSLTTTPHWRIYARWQVTSSRSFPYRLSSRSNQDVPCMKLVSDMQPRHNPLTRWVKMAKPTTGLCHAGDQL